jgi:UDP-glucose 4-epimerase
MTRDELSGPVLVTGGTGFIGSHLVRALVARGARVHLLQRAGSDPWRLAEVAGCFTTQVAELADAPALERVCRAVRPAVVYHLACDTEVRHLDRALAGVTRSVAENVLGTLHLVRALHATGSARILVRLGGLEEYGRGPAPYRETQREAPVSPYSAGQVALTHYLQMLQPMLAFAAVTLRPALVYGPAQSERFFVPALVRACLAGRDFDMTTGEQVRELLHVDDLVAALLRAGATSGLEGEVLNIGGGRSLRVVDLARLIVRLTGSKSALRVGVLPARPSEIEQFHCDASRAEERLGWRATTELEAGLAATIAWYRAHP